jgi:hypothetical protein
MTEIRALAKPELGQKLRGGKNLNSAFSCSLGQAVLVCYQRTPVQLGGSRDQRIPSVRYVAGPEGFECLCVSAESCMSKPGKTEDHRSRRNQPTYAHEGQQQCDTPIWFRNDCELLNRDVGEHHIEVALVNGNSQDICGAGDIDQGIDRVAVHHYPPHPAKATGFAYPSGWIA